MAKKKIAKRVDWKAKFRDQTFAFAGRLQLLDRKGATKRIEIYGGKAVDKVSADLDYLVVGKIRGGGPSQAEKRAVKLNADKGASIQIVAESDFLAMLIPTREEAIAMLSGGDEGLKAWESIRWHAWQFPANLSCAKFRGAELPGVNLRDVNLDGSDLRDAELTGALLPVMRNVKLDRAVLREACPVGLVDCSLKKADMSDGRLYYHSGAYERVDFTGASLRGVKNVEAKFVNAIFKNADLSEAELRLVDFSGCDLTRALLTAGEFQRCVFSNAKLTKADLSGSDFSDAKFREADLRNADLRNANLANADFENAIIDGANFEGANLTGAKIASLDAAKAKGLEVARGKIEGKIGPNLRKWHQMSGKAGGLETTAEIEFEDGHATVGVQVYGSWCSVESLHHGPGKPRRYYNYTYQRSKILNTWMKEANRFAHGSLRIDAIKAKSYRSPSLRGKALEELSIAAWCEVFGVEIPSAEELKEKAKAKRTGQKKIRDQLLAELRGGSDGVKLWNKRPASDIAQAGHFRREEFSGLNLTGAKFDGADFQGADFSGATLVRAKAQNGCNFKKAVFANVDLSRSSLRRTAFQSADFANAKLIGATLQSSNLKEANLKGADLTRASLASADLCGADLSSASLDGTNLKHTRYDEKTRFPKKYVVPDDAKWVGAGLPPHERMKRKKAGPVDLSTFMKRLAESVDGPRLDKALKMLKADRFQLFVQVSDDNLIGVVKSQSDPDLVYSCRLASDGGFACCTQNLNSCGGLRGALCKHLLVLVVGLSKSGDVDPTTIDEWIAASQAQKPKLDKEIMSETLLRYKGAEAGEVDWRPMETIPEDYYAL